VNLSRTFLQSLLGMMGNGETPGKKQSQAVQLGLWEIDKL
jgi:hypothetical protein